MLQLQKNSQARDTMWQDRETNSDKKNIVRKEAGLSFVFIDFLVNSMNTISFSSDTRRRELGTSGVRVGFKGGRPNLESKIQKLHTEKRPTSRTWGRAILKLVVGGEGQAPVHQHQAAELRLSQEVVFRETFTPEFISLASVSLASRKRPRQALRLHPLPKAATYCCCCWCCGTAIVFAVRLP